MAPLSFTPSPSPSPAAAAALWLASWYVFSRCVTRPEAQVHKTQWTYDLLVVSGGPVAEPVQRATRT